MEITFLGTSSGTPTPYRNVTSIALRLAQRKEIWLFDCGEGTQHQIIRSNLNLSHLSRIFITHMHGDHTLGLMGLLATAGMTGKPTAIDLYGPDSLNEYLKACERFTHTNVPYPVAVHKIEPGLFFEDEEFMVSCALLKHRIPAFGYRVEEKERAGKFNVEQAKALGIPSGPLYGKLKQGESLTLPNGVVVEGKNLCDPPQPGRVLVYCSDTTFSEESVKLAQGADVLIHECTYAQEDETLAVRGGHSTTAMAAQVALQAGVKKLILTHFSPRYSKDGGIRLSDLLNQAQAIFPNTEMAHDFFTHTITKS